MENKPLKLNSKVSAELLNILAKTVGVFRDLEINEAFNRVEIQVKEYEESGQACDLTYLRDLCNQFDDKLTAMCKTKSEMAKMMMSPDIMEKLGLQSSSDKSETGDKEKGCKVTGFKS